MAYWVRGPNGQPILYEHDNRTQWQTVADAEGYRTVERPAEDLSWLTSEAPTLTEEQIRQGYFLMPFFSGTDTALEGGIGQAGEVYTPSGQQRLNYFDVVSPKPANSPNWVWNTNQKKWDAPSHEAGWKEELNATMNIVVPALLAYATGGTVGAAAGSTIGGAAAGGLNSAMTGSDMATGMVTGGVGAAAGTAAQPYSSDVGPLTQGQSMANAATKGAVSSGLGTAVRGGNEEEILQSALGGAVGGAVTSGARAEGVNPELSRAIGGSASTAATGGTSDEILASGLTSAAGSYGGRTGEIIARQLIANEQRNETPTRGATQTAASSNSGGALGGLGALAPSLGLLGALGSANELIELAGGKKQPEEKQSEEKKPEEIPNVPYEQLFLAQNPWLAALAQN